jgi:hypothetical protein
LLYTWDPSFVNFDVRDFDISWKHILITFFELSLLVSTNRDNRRWMEIRLPHSPDIQQVTLSSVKPCLSQGKFDCFRVWWNDVLCQSLHIPSCVRSCIAVNINFYALYAVRSFGYLCHRHVLMSCNKRNRGNELNRGGGGV